MTTNTPFVITISRQLGSGGAILGKCLSEKMGILYLDREIVYQAAQKLAIVEEELAYRDEKLTSFWQSFAQSAIYSAPENYAASQMIQYTDMEVFTAEAEIIERVAGEHDSVIVGRGGAYVLRNHPRHLSIFLHADVKIRQQRIKEVMQLSDHDAHKLIEHGDKERARYHHMLTGQNWTDARQYHLAINTGVVTLEETAALVMDCAKRQLGIK